MGLELSPAEAAAYQEYLARKQRAHDALQKIESALRLRDRARTADDWALVCAWKHHDREVSAEVRTVGGRLTLYARWPNGTMTDRIRFEAALRAVDGIGRFARRGAEIESLLDGVPT